MGRRIPRGAVAARLAAGVKRPAAFELTLLSESANIITHFRQGSGSGERAF